jgi:hypothetical protein
MHEIGRQGTFVSGAPRAGRNAQQQLAAAADQFVAAIRKLGLSRSPTRWAGGCRGHRRYRRADRAVLRSPAQVRLLVRSVTRPDI